MSNLDLLIPELKRHDSFKFSLCKLYLYLVTGSYFVFHFFRVFVCASRKGNRKSRCFLAVCQREYYNLKKAMRKLDKELDVVKVINRIRQHNEALKSSILCDKRRRDLIKHSKACTVDVNTDSDQGDKLESQVTRDSRIDAKHGYCRSNELLITENIFRRVLEQHPGC